MGLVRRSGRLWCYAWASPTTAIGLVVGGLTLMTRGRVQVRCGALEFHGGFARWALQRTPIRASAMTLGHVILGRDPDCLDFCREHEQAHVRQVERWGPAFLPAYFFASLWAWSRGGHPYLDNRFERKAREACGDWF